MGHSPPQRSPSPEASVSAQPFSDLPNVTSRQRKDRKRPELEIELPRRHPGRLSSGQDLLMGNHLLFGPSDVQGKHIFSGETVAVSASPTIFSPMAPVEGKPMLSPKPRSGKRSLSPESSSAAFRPRQFMNANDTVHETSNPDDHGFDSSWPSGTMNHSIDLGTSTEMVETNKTNNAGTMNHNIDLGTSTEMVETDKTNNAGPVPECLSNSTGWLTGQCIASLLDLVSAAAPLSSCIADTSCTATARMIENGCLAAARTSAATIILPLHLPTKHWCLAVLPLTGEGHIEAFDSMPSTANTRTIRRMVRDFIHQLVQVWPSDARPLPASFRTDTPDVVFLNGPAQDNTYDCGVAVIMVAMHVVANVRLPRTCLLGQWRRILCFLHGEVPTTPDPKHDGAISTLLTIDDPLCHKVRTEPVISGLPAPPAVLGDSDATLGNVERYYEEEMARLARVKQCMVTARSEKLEAAETVKESLRDMASVVSILHGRLTRLSPEVAEFRRWVQPNGTGHQERVRLAIEMGAVRLRIANEVVGQGLEDVDRVIGRCREKQPAGYW
ncbi:hypothetical protein QBC39DRAFT_360384 [Podospora conica]|nr:hypothetical protein QBC39DRAFT_360384 [Schizothecium conicum]